jgi:hypothetical protein
VTNMQTVIATTSPHGLPQVARVDLYWLPLGAGESSACVRWNGRLFEALMARRDQRLPRDLYHSALDVHLGNAHFVIEMTPAWGNPHSDRGVVSTGAVGLPALGRSRFFRYEVRRWRDGTIPDLAEAVGGAQGVTDDVALAQRLLELVPHVPTATWGRDEFRTGDMWNSNSLTSWLLARSGIHRDDLLPPQGGRAPGWDAGLVIADRQARGDMASPPLRHSGKRSGAPRRIIDRDRSPAVSPACFEAETRGCDDLAGRSSGLDRTAER